MINNQSTPNFTPLMNTSTNSVVFGDALRCYWFTHDDLKFYDDMLMNMKLYGAEVEWCLTNDPDEIYSNLQDLQSPIFVLCTNPENYEKSVSACRYFQQNGERLVFLITKLDIAFSQSVNTHGVRICVAKDDISTTLHDISESIFSTSILPSIICIDATDVFSTISKSNPAKVHVFSAHKDAVSRTINAVTSKIRSALFNPEGQYVIGYIAHDKNNPVGLKDYKKLDDFLRSYFTNHPEILISVIEMQDKGCYCNLMIG